MSYTIENVWSSPGTEITGASLSGANKMHYDGRYLWVTCGSSGIAIYDHWYEDINRSPSRPGFTGINELVYAGFREQDLALAGIPQNKLKLVTFIKITATNVVRSTCVESLAEPGATKVDRHGVSTPITETIGDGAVTFNVLENNFGDSVFSKTTARTGAALNAYWITQIQDKIYIANGSNFSTIFEFSTQTQNLIRQISVADQNGLPMLSNLEAAHGKLWMIGQFWSNTSKRQVITLDPATNLQTSVDLQAISPSSARSYIANGQNGFVYITNYNSFGVSKYNAETGVFVKNIRVNGYPQGIWAGPDRKIWVTSFGGMLSMIDYDDDQVHNDYATESIALRVQSDPTNGGFVWFVNTDTKKLVHYNLNNLSQYENGDEEDWQYTNEQMDAAPTEFALLPGFTYQDETLTTKTVKPSIVALMGSKLVTWNIGFTGSPDDKDPARDVTYFDYKYPFEFAEKEDDRYPYRVIYAELTGQAAVVTASNFFGE